MECDILVEKVNLYKQPRQAVRTSAGRKEDITVTILQKLNSVGVIIIIIIIMRENKQRSLHLSPAELG